MVAVVQEKCESIGARPRGVVLDLGIGGGGYIFAYDGCWLLVVGVVVVFRGLMFEMEEDWEGLRRGWSDI